jgi:hypothetical protein
LAEVEDRAATVAAKIQIADQTAEPVRQNLARNNQTLNPDTLSAMARMHVALDRAKRELAAGDGVAARDDLGVADALATKVLRAFGR